jgi:hypothetical protein
VKLLKLTKKINPDATDEEEAFIDQMSKDLQTMKRSHKTTSEAIKKARVLFN